MMLPSFSLPLLLLATTSQLAWAIDIYLLPQTTLFSSNLTPDDALAALSRHLGLEAFQTFRDPSQAEEQFVGQGIKHTLVITAEETDAKAILPHGFQRTFSLETPPRMVVESLDSVISTYLHQARHTFATSFDSFQFGEPSDVEELNAFFMFAGDPAFAAINLSRLADVRRLHGPYSDEYEAVVNQMRNFLQNAFENDNFNLAVMTFVPPVSVAREKRQEPRQTQSPLPPSNPQPQQPIGGISTCFTTLDSCNNGTSACSGHGQCVQASKSGRTCFVCSCVATKTGEGNGVKTTQWAGESCERKDISSTFVLFTGTVLAIIILIVTSISLLNSVGEQPLPSTLLATAVGAKRD